MTDAEIREALADCPDQRTTARRAAKWIDVLAHRASPESAYVPMSGGLPAATGPAFLSRLEAAE